MAHSTTGEPPDDERFDPELILRRLNAAGVQYVLIGGFAVILQGHERFTTDLDLCYERSRQNVRRLVAVLRAIHAVPRDWPEGVPFVLDEQTVLNGDSFTFATDFGHVDVIGTPDGTGGYADLAPGRETYDVGEGLTVAVAAIPDLLRMKRASSTQPERAAKDLADIEALRHLAGLRGHAADAP